MIVQSVQANNRRRCFTVRTRKGELAFPYALAEPRPAAGDGVVAVEPDPELGREAFTYRLASGAEGSVHLDAVLAYHRDPEHLADLLLYELTVQAEQALEHSPLSVREVARRLGTSPAQLYRLLDATNVRKSVRQMLELLFVLGCKVDVRVRPPRRTA